MHGHVAYDVFLHQVAGFLGYALTPDGASLVYGERSQAGEQLWIWPLDGTSPAKLLRPASTEARISPDGRYYTFVAVESGRNEVFLAPLAGGTSQVGLAGLTMIVLPSCTARV